MCMIITSPVHDPDCLFSQYYWWNQQMVSWFSNFLYVTHNSVAYVGLNGHTLMFNSVRFTSHQHFIIYKHNFTSYQPCSLDKISKHNKLNTEQGIPK